MYCKNTHVANGEAGFTLYPKLRRTIQMENKRGIDGEFTHLSTKIQISDRVSEVAADHSCARHNEGSGLMREELEESPL